MINFRNRPLTPHFTIYKTESSSLYSIWHRITGIIILCFLCINLFVIKMFNWGIWQEYCIIYCLLIFNNIIIINLYLFLIYHILNGLRYIIWDINIYLYQYSFIVISIIIYFLIY